MVNVLIKNMDEETYKRAKLMAIQEEKPISQIIKEGILALVEKRQRKKGRLSDLPAFDFGPGTEHLSEEIDDILYGPRQV